MLPLTEFIEGLFSLLYVIICTLMGILITSRYFKYKEKTFLFIGIATIGLAVTHWSSSISFLTNSFFDVPLPAEIYLFISSGFIGIFTFLWILGINNLLFEGKNKIFLIFFAILFSTMEITFFVLFFINPVYIGIVEAPYNLDATMTGIIPIIFSIIYLSIIVITGLWASIRSIKSTNPLIKLKGRVLFFNFLLWLIAISLDINTSLDIIGVVIMRILLILSSVGFYIGWVMPKIFQKFFIKIKLLKTEPN